MKRENMMAPRLMSVANYKTVKGQAMGYYTGILHLASSDISGYNVCPKATVGCKTACLYFAGRGQMPAIQVARINRTKKLFENRDKFLEDLRWDIRAVARKADRIGMVPCFRINGTSDLPWLAIKMAEEFPQFQFFDYTKVLHTLTRKLPSNYHLTFSRAEDNLDECIEALRLGFNVAAVFKQRPETYLGFPVTNGDETDLRFLDPLGYIVALSAKGRAKRDTSGFVIDV